MEFIGVVKKYFFYKMVSNIFCFVNRVNSKVMYMYLKENID